MHFSTPLFFIALLLLPCLFFAGRKRQGLGHSQVSLHAGIRSLPLLARIPSACRLLFLVTLVFTLAQPQLLHKSVRRTIQTRDFVITVDVSGSMSDELKDPQQQQFVKQNQVPQADSPNADFPIAGTDLNSLPKKAPSFDIPGLALFGLGPKIADPSKEATKLTRAMAAREGVRQFLLRRKNDRVGLITFDDRCYYSEPIGKPEAVTKKLDSILHSGSGTNFDGPSSSSEEPGAIECSIRHFIDMKATQTRVLIMVTDGEDSIDPDRANQLAKLIHEQHIKMYVLGVGERWTGNTRLRLQEFVESVSGEVIRIGDAKQMREAFALIDKLEASKAETETQERAEELYPYFAAAALLLLLIWTCGAAYLRESH